MNNKKETEVKRFTRNELIDISERAKQEAEIRDLNPFWKYAYQALACAADHLDAMFARSEVELELE
jgi:hypothetical protein